ncbi:heparinase II/III domain-containing protein [Algoriphagus halophilus]|uniref:Heparinase II/III-like protein n=1 Tax=Algoriphagus halophilus TaxID=226505 RepID=A0A1N6HU62_9BACT|nr:heparinase II/III family protein [Algoriphagus halophilus]SIO23303.1 Heparinase II/III-like protein [Algoriphagus halophilus]
MSLSYFSRFLLLFLFLISTTPSIAQKTSPSLFISKNPKTNTPFLQAVQIEFLKVADGVAALPTLPRELTGRRLLSVSRAYLKRITYLGYAFQLTGDEKYLKAVEKNLLAAADFQDWNPSHFLDVAEMTMAMGIGYDWVHVDLSEESAQKIREAIVEKGLKPSLAEDYWWINTTNNWNQVCHASLAVGAWAVSDYYPELAKEILARSEEKIHIPEAQYNPDGAYPEGTSYWEYGTTFHVLYLDAFRKKHPELGLPVSEGFLKTGNYFLHAHGPTGSFNYSDSRQSEVMSAGMYWFASKTQQPSLLFKQIPLLQEFLDQKRTLDPANTSNRFFIFLMIWLSELDTTVIPTPDQLTWTGNGENPVSFQRSGWTKDAIYVGTKAGSPEVSHGHMDIGSFVMDAKGVRWAIDLGMNDYNALESQGVNIWDGEQDGERWSVFRYTNYSHNTLVVDSALQNIHGKAEILKVKDKKSLKSTSLDLSEVYENHLKSAERTTLIKKGREVRIVDEIQNNSDISKVRWGMMTYDAIRFNGKNQAIISKGEEKLKLEVIYPKNAQLQLYPVNPTAKGEETNEGMILIGFETTLSPDQKQKLEVRLIPMN